MFENLMFNPNYRNSMYSNNYIGANTIQPPQPQIQCFFVGSKDDAKNIQVQLNTIYIAINKADKEIYVKQLNNDGNIDFMTYKDETFFKKEEPKQEKDYTEYFATLTSKLDNIEKNIKEKQNNFYKQNKPRNNENNPQQEQRSLINE